MDWIATHIPPWFWIAAIAHAAIMGTVAYLILLERKIAAWTQDRVGPNRVGLGFGIIPWLKDKRMFGLGQPVADGLKMLLKEDYRPAGSDKVLFTIAPAVMILVMVVSIAVLPWGGVKQTTRTYEINANVEDPVAAAIEQVPHSATVIGTPTIERIGGDEAGAARVTLTYRWPFQIADLNIGVLFILAVLSVAVYSVVIGGWASNNKYSFLGGLRAAANMISYEIPLGLSVLTIIVMFGTLSLTEIVDRQAHYWFGFIPAWNIFTQPLAFLLFLTCIHAEANRAPFDTAEAEQELVGGYHTEYSAMRFGLFFLSEYAGMITTSAVCVALFFGGWHLPFLSGNVDAANPSVTTSLAVCLVRALVFFAKTLLIIAVFMWVRWSLPRFRFDQIMSLAWRAMIPMSLVILFATALTIFFFGHRDAMFVETGVISWKMALVLLIVNVITMIVLMIGAALVPEAPQTNRRVRVVGSRFAHTPVPAPAPAQIATAGGAS